MTSKLVQKHPMKGSREFQIIDDEIQCTIKSPFKTETFNVILDILEEEPIRTSSMLSFKSKVNKEPLVEFFLDKPDKGTFDSFVNYLQLKIIENDFGRFRIGETSINVDVARLDESIEMLQKYVDSAEIELFLSTLVELKTKPSDVECQNKVAKSFNELGFTQALVITYAPYINFIFSGKR